MSLLAVARREKRFTERLGNITLQPADVVLLQGPAEIDGERGRSICVKQSARRRFVIDRTGVVGALI